MKTWYRLALMALILTMSIGCDQVTKKVATDMLMFSTPRSFLGDLFRLEYAENQGGFLSLGRQMPPEVRFWLLTIGVGIFLSSILLWVLLNSKLTPPQVSGLSLVMGGGFSNLLDRIFKGGAVVDFMNLGIGSLRTGVFNVADLTIELVLQRDFT